MSQKINQKCIEIIKKFEGVIPFAYLCQGGFATIGCGHLCQNSDNYMGNLTVEKIKKSINENPQKIEYNGILVTSNSEIKEKTTINEKQIDDLLEEDLGKAIKAVKKLISVPLSDNQFSSLVSFTFNVGEYNLKKSTLRKKLNSGDYNSVPQELNRWVYSGSFQMQDLIIRRRMEGKLFAKNI